MNTTVVVTINLIYIPYCFFFFSIIFLSSFFRRYCIDVAAAAVVYMSHMSVYVYSDSLDKIEQTSVCPAHTATSESMYDISQIWFDSHRKMNGQPSGTETGSESAM